MDKYNIAIVGAGPAGLSAAGRASQLDQANGVAQPSYILLEGFERPAKTIQQYQKGKHVMAEPGYLNLRSDFQFEQGTREAILQTWDENLDTNGVNIRYGTEVTKISGQQGAFQLALSDGSSIEANFVILSIGLQGNPRRLGVPGSEHPQVQYQLDDPDEYSKEEIIVVGAGDAAIENAIALAAQNNVKILNRKSEFSRAKEGNLNAIINASTDDKVPLECLYESQIKELVHGDDPSSFTAVIQTADGEVEVPANRIIARLGAIPPRKFIESMGIEFPNDHIESLPELDDSYQSNVPGIYLIGALAGYPLIKQAMNQGYDVVEFIHGNRVEPADQVLLEVRFSGLPFPLSVNEQVHRFQRVIPLFAQLNSLQFRELLIESEMLVAVGDKAARKKATNDQSGKISAATAELPADAQQKVGQMATRLISAGDVIFQAGSYNTSVYTVVSGSVSLERVLASGNVERTTVERGDFFGETSLLSGHAALETATADEDCVLVETPRRLMLKLMSSNEVVKEGIEWKFIFRELQRHFTDGESASSSRLMQLAEQLEVVECKAGDVLFDVGQDEPWMYLIKSGGFTISQVVDGTEVFLAEERSGRMLGQLAVMGDSVRRTKTVANVQSEVIKIDKHQYAELSGGSDQALGILNQMAADQQYGYAKSLVRQEKSGAMKFLLDNGLGEATNTLVIDENLCVGCDNCEKACAETHSGISRLNRKHGPSYGSLHIATACRHCEHPHCMKDCPPNAIRKDPSGAVYINDDCIGCGNCQSNCPYGDDLHKIIRMASPPKRRSGLLTWMLFGLGDGPGEPAAKKKKGGTSEIKKAFKCDACVTKPGAPACVLACPTGAAQRVGPLDYIQLVDRQG